MRRVLPRICEGVTWLGEVIEALKLVTHGTERSVVKLMEVAKEEFAYDYEEFADFVLESSAR